MKTLEIIIEPKSGFGTPLKGDSLFGHLCWQFANDPDLLGKSLDSLLADYSQNPFLVVSSAVPYLEGASPQYAFKRPALPLHYLFSQQSSNPKEGIENRKKMKAQNWMLVKAGSPIGSLCKQTFLNDQELLEKMTLDRPEENGNRFEKKSGSFTRDFLQPHNSINRLTGSTGDGQFAPFSVEQRFYFPGAKLALFFAIQPDLPEKGMKEALERIGLLGFGKDASTGLGKFRVLKMREVDLKKMGNPEPDACYCLSPSVPEPGIFSKAYFTPFIRYGRHGDHLAIFSNPFKNPVLYADEGAVFVPTSKEVFSRSFLGRSLNGLSKIFPKTVGQGFSLFVPITMEVAHV